MEVNDWHDTLILLGNVKQVVKVDKDKFDRFIRMVEKRIAEKEEKDGELL